MKHIIMIDVPTLSEMASNPYKEQKFLFMCDILKKLSPSVLVLHQDVESLLYSAFTSRWHLYSAFGDIANIVAGMETKDRDIISIPDMIGTICDSEQKKMESVSLCMLHKDAKARTTLFFVSSERWGGNASDTLNTILDKKEQRHECVICDETVYLQKLIEAHTPILDQHKHKDKPYMLNGELVSPFATYFREGKEVAEKMLERAYHESELIDTEMFPHYLYTWDNYERTFVEFRRMGPEGTRLYHGFEIPQKDWYKVPKKIKEKYHQ